MGTAADHASFLSKLDSELSTLLERLQNTAGAKQRAQLLGAFIDVLNFTRLSQRQQN